MEALESLGIDWKLLLAQIVNFLVVLFLLWKFLYKPIVGMLSERKSKIEQGLKDAEESKRQLEETNERTRKLIAEAALESEKIIKSAKTEIESETKKKLEEAQKKAEEIIATSQKLAKQEQEKVVAEAKKEIADLALTITEKILREKADKSTVDKAMEEI